MPYRGIRGSWRIKKSYGSVAGVDIPPFNLSLDTEKEALAHSIEEKINELQEWGIHGAAMLLRIANREIRPIDAYHTIKNKSVKDIPLIMGSESLLDKWVALLPVWKKKSGELLGARTRHDYRLYINQLVTALPDAKHKNLADALMAYRQLALKKGNAEQYKKVKMACLSYARNTDGRHSELWKAVSSVDGMKSGTKRKVNSAMRYYDALALIAKLPSEQMQAIAKQMLLTGMSAGEYVADFEVKEDRISIHGQKNALRVRDVPKLANFKTQAFSYYQPGKGTIRNKASGEPVTYKAFNEAVLLASGEEHTSNTFRHSYQLYLRKAQIDSWRAFTYAGHQIPLAERVQEKYTRSEETSFLLEDTERLLVYLKSEKIKPKDARKKLVLLD